jgi:uncharacterized NAD(P)/FAD-binding protein YdhS
MPGTAARTITVAGDGVTGALFALKMAAARPDWTVRLVGDTARPGRGLAYGRCKPHHLLNVTVNRMEVGLQTSFRAWLAARGEPSADALDEGGGNAGEAFVPRALFGIYVAEQLAIASNANPLLEFITSRAVAVRREPSGLVLADGRVLPMDRLVLATGHLPPRLPFPCPSSPRVLVDPWAAWPVIAPDAAVLLVGSGLTMVDVVLSLRALGHRGVIHAVSRHGLLPRLHQGGGAWPAFLNPGMTSRQVLRAIRHAVRQAQAAGVPWQRVFDAARPLVATLWHDWPLQERTRFLRHLRAIWDVHRHRTAPRRGLEKSWQRCSRMAHCP